MNNKTLGWLVIAPVALALLTALFENSLGSDADFLYSIAGLGMFLFGIWGGIRLINLDKKK